MTGQFTIPQGSNIEKILESLFGHLVNKGILSEDEIKQIIKEGK